MSIALDPTPEHQALAAAVNARMAADSRIVNAKAALLRLAGVGALMALTGVGVAAALFGWSLVKDERPSADKIADALVRALDRTTLKAAGEFRLAPGSTVRLDNATVALDPNATVRVGEPLKLDPAATVRLDSEPRSPGGQEGAQQGSQPGNQPGNQPGAQARPTSAQLRQDAKPGSGARAVTNYTIFKSVPLGQGSVVTGWSFSSSEQTAPTRQYCYYVQDAGADGGSQVKVDVAIDGQMLPNLRPRGFEPAAAAASCTWFDGKATRNS